MTRRSVRGVMSKGVVLSVALLTAGCPGLLWAAGAGDLDLSFGGDGSVTTAVGGSHDFA